MVAPYIFPPQAIPVPKTPAVTKLTVAGAGNYTPTTNLLRITMIGAGASGAGNVAGNGGGGGGSGEWILNRTVPCTAGVAIAYTVGAGGVAVLNDFQTAGGDTIFGALTAKGAPRQTTNKNNGGAGGGRLGAASPGTGVGTIGAQESMASFGGSSGGGAANPGAAGGPADGVPLGGAGGTGGFAGGGGASSPFGTGGVGANTNGGTGGSPAATAYGAGAGGGESTGAQNKGGDGAVGAILVEEIGS